MNDYPAHLRTAYLTVCGAGGVETGGCIVVQFYRKAVQNSEENGFSQLLWDCARDCILTAT